MTIERPPRLIALIGSGETAPRMTRLHRTIAARLAGGAGAVERVKAAIIDTPYGFQSNADALSATLVEYFSGRLGMSASVASLRRADVDALARETAYVRVRNAQFVFSGPGSPSYAIRHWSGTQIPALFGDKLTNGGALVLASAAALTMGRLAVPVYEMYKAGDDPYWLPALDVLSQIGICAAVIPHFDNAEGGRHDTRFCFLGERNLAALEEKLPADVFILGIDEHTAALLDLDAERVTIHGRGRLTMRERGRSTVVKAGDEIPLAELRRAPATSAGASAAQRGADRVAAAAGSETSEMASRLLAVEAELDALRERATLVEPLIEALLDVRAAARAAGDYGTADRIRQRLVGAGIEVSDSDAGMTSYRLRKR